MQKPIFLAILGLMFTLNAAWAHITFKVKNAQLREPYLAALRVPHGCEGKPTDTVKVRLAPGAVAVQPQSKEGWTFETVEAGYEQAYALNGVVLNRGIQQIIWTGGTLADKIYDQFEFTVQFADSMTAGDVLYFPVVQQCGDETERWIELPTGTEGPELLQYPAPAILIVGGK